MDTSGEPVSASLQEKEEGVQQGEVEEAPGSSKEGAPYLSDREFQFVYEALGTLIRSGVESWDRFKITQEVTKASDKLLQEVEPLDIQTISDSHRKAHVRDRKEHIRDPYRKEHLLRLRSEYIRIRSELMLVIQDNRAKALHGNALFVGECMKITHEALSKEPQEVDLPLTSGYISLADQGLVPI